LSLKFPLILLDLLFSFGDTFWMDISDTLIDLYRFPGFEPRRRITTSHDDPYGGVIITLDHRPKKDSAVPVANSPDNTTTRVCEPFVISLAATVSSHCTSRSIVWSAFPVVA
jgi:hypothetical protein